jgi:hypothetical protein
VLNVTFGVAPLAKADRFELGDVSAVIDIGVDFAVESFEPGDDPTLPVVFMRIGGNSYPFSFWPLKVTKLACKGGLHLMVEGSLFTMG